MITICTECRRIFGHERRCPNYISPKSRYYCSICDNGIQEGDIYIKNDYGDYAHWDCIDGEGYLLEWLGYGTMVMD